MVRVRMSKMMGRIMESWVSQFYGLKPICLTCVVVNQPYGFNRELGSQMDDTRIESWVGRSMEIFQGISVQLQISLDVRLDWFEILHDTNKTKKSNVNLAAVHLQAVNQPDPGLDLVLNFG